MTPTMDENRKRSPLQALRTRWTALSPADRRRVPLVLTIFLAVALLMLHIFATLPAQDKARQDLSRIQGRAKQSASATKKTMTVPRLTGKSVVVLKREVEGLQAEIARQQARLADVEPRFASLADPSQTRELYDALTVLASRSDLRIGTLALKGLKKEERNQAPTMERLAQLASETPYGRPVVRLEADASFRGLMQLLQGLESLPYRSSPVWMSVEVKTDAPEGGRPRLQWLQVAMELTL